MFTRFVIGALAALYLLAAQPVYAAEEYYEATLHSATATTGDGAILNVENYGTVAITVTMSSTGTVTFNGSEDKTAYPLKGCTSSASTSGAVVTGATASGTFQCNVAGLQRFKVPVTANGGTITVHATVSTAPLGGSGGSGGGGGLTDTELRATPVPVSGTVTATGPLTDTQLRATAVPVSGSVSCSNCSGSGASAVDDAAFTPATGSVAPLGAFFDDVTPDSVDEGDAGLVRMSANRNLYSTIRDAAGNERGANVNASNELLTSSNTELPAAVQSTTTGQTAPTAPFVNAFMHCQDSGATTISPCIASPNIAHDAVATSANPLLVGGYASAAAPTDVSADGDAVRAWRLRNGAGVIQPSYAGVLALTGNGVAGTGTPRFTIASDNTAFGVVPTPATSGGSTPCYFTSAATNNAQFCKASAGQIYGYEVINTTATVYYLRLYNLTAAPTCSSATGFVRSIPIPASTTGNGVVRDMTIGEAYSTGIAFCLTAEGSSTGNTSAATGVYISINYK